MAPPCFHISQSVSQASSNEETINQLINQWDFLLKLSDKPELVKIHISVFGSKWMVSFEQASPWPPPPLSGPHHGQAPGQAYQGAPYSIYLIVVDM